MDDKIEKLKELKKLLEQGMIEQSEFDILKADVLRGHDSISNPQVETESSDNTYLHEPGGVKEGPDRETISVKDAESRNISRKPGVQTSVKMRFEDHLTQARSTVQIRDKALKKNPKSKTRKLIVLVLAGIAFIVSVYYIYDLIMVNRAATSEGDGNIHNEISEKNMTTIEESMTSDHLWTRYQLSVPEQYKVGDIEQLIYGEIPEIGSDDWGLGYNAPSFYPIGWSLNGELFASRVFYDAWGGYDIIIISDIITDERVDMLRLSYYDEEADHFVYEHHLNGKDVDVFLKQYNIAPNFEYAKGTIYQSKLLDKSYRFEIEADEQLFDYEESNAGKIEIFASFNVPNTKRKKVATLKSAGNMYAVYIDGIIKSPIENRAILLIVFEHQGFEGEHDVSINLFGCRLQDNDFRR